MAGYSGTPLVKKLGLKEGCRLALVSAPDGFSATLGPLPPGASVVPEPSAEADAALLFVRTVRELKERFAWEAGRVGSFGMLWVAWPKKASGVPTDLNDQAVREFGLACGLVDVKVCAIDETWSALKFVTRVSDRPKKKA